MKSLQELITENKYYYINEHCFGEYYSEEKIETYSCEQCGNWNGSLSGGRFCDLLLESVVGALDCTVSEAVQELGVSNVIHIDDYFNYYIMQDYDVDEAVNTLTTSYSLYNYDIHFIVEDDEYCVNLSEIPNNIIKDALIILFSDN